MLNDLWSGWKWTCIYIEGLMMDGVHVEGQRGSSGAVNDGNGVMEGQWGVAGSATTGELETRYEKQSRKCENMSNDGVEL